MSHYGRPRSLSDAKKEKLLDLISLGYSVDEAARYVGCTSRTVRNEARHDAEFGDMLTAAKGDLQMLALRTVRKEASWNWRAAAWLLERMNPNRFNLKQLGRTSSSVHSPSQTPLPESEVTASEERKIVPNCQPALARSLGVHASSQGELHDE